MQQTKSWVKVVKAILYNAKWIMVGILLLNVFAFGYWDKMMERGLGGEETLWAVVMLIVILLLVAFDKGWKNFCDKVCNAL